jgi:hypothetical protein
MASRAFFLAPGHSSRILDDLGTEVDDAQDGSWRRCWGVGFTWLLSCQCFLH